MKWPWMHFKYLDNIYLQCTICDANVLSTFESVENHLSLHSEEQQKNYKYKCWPCKYCTQEDDFMVKCDICHNNISIYVSQHLNIHIKLVHPDKLRDTQETHHTDLSKCVLSLGTGTTSELILSLKDCYVLLKKSPHHDLYM